VADGCRASAPSRLTNTAFSVELANGHDVPLPVNRRTVNEIFGLRLKRPAEVKAFLKTQAVVVGTPVNAAQ
jgi:hypothetical protein